MTALARNPKATWKGDGVGAGAYTGGPPKALLHATIAGSNALPGYDGGYSAPHETYLWRPDTKVLRAVQHTDYTIAARSLRNEPGGVETNRDHTLQIELAGYIGSWGTIPTGGFDIEAAPDTYWEQLADLWGPVVVSHGVKNVTFEPPWIPSNRMGLSYWDNYSGLCAHILCPENDHVDLRVSDHAQQILLDKIWGGGSSIIPSPIPVVFVNTPTPPTFPLPKYHYFYYASPSPYIHSGWYSSADRAGLRTWQSRMRYRGWTITVDGVYGNQTNSVARAFQREKGLTVDGKIGLNTWNKAWTAPIT